MSCLNILDENGIFYCDYCPAKFSTNSNRLKHMKTSKKCLSKRQNVEVNCLWCNERFISSIMLERHYKICKVKKECIWCDKTFVSSIELETHSKLCKVNKDDAYISLKKRIEELTAQLKHANDCLNLYG